jgi:hypothetical protein
MERLLEKGRFARKGYTLKKIGQRNTKFFRAFFTNGVIERYFVEF